MLSNFGFSQLPLPLVSTLLPRARDGLVLSRQVDKKKLTEPADSVSSTGMLLVGCFKE